MIRKVRSNRADEREWAAGLVRLLSPRGPRRSLGYFLGAGGVALLTALFLPVRASITPLNKGFLYLAVVLVAAAVGGLWPGVLASVLGFIAFNFFFLPPHHTFAIAKSEDVVILFVYLALSVVISVLLAQAQERGATADARRALLAAVSHELRSPLAAIKASVTDLLADDTEHDPATTREALQSVDGETDRLNALIANLLDMSRIEGGLLQARIHDADLAEAVVRSVERVRKLRPEVEVRIEVGTSWLVRADLVYLERVVGNLIENAARAADESAVKRVDVVIEQRDDRVMVKVVDHGKGIRPEERAHLFYPFYRIDERHPHLGPGLGLAITKGFLSLMQGEVWVEDTVGGGATFAFSLPAATPASLHTQGAS
jgi:two-component system, OmpR family, sensor histidine kinase KdpD